MELIQDITDHSIMLDTGEDCEDAVLQMGADDLVGGEEVPISVQVVKVNPRGGKNSAGVVEDGDGCCKGWRKDSI